MERTISAMVGKGSVNHNSRKFKAENVDGSRTHPISTTAMKISKKSITNCLTKLSKGIIQSRQEPTAE